MPSGTARFDESKHELHREVETLFDDIEARSNIVGLYDLLLKVDRRTRPDLYELRSETLHD